MWRTVACAGIGAALVLPLAIAGPRAQTREVTFSKDVAPVVFENCVYCHRPGEVALFSFLTYKDARPWARSIKQKLLNGQMRPWKADPHYGDFQNTKILGKRDLDALVASVDGGAKEGNPKNTQNILSFVALWLSG